MGQSLSQMYIHLTFGTKNRYPFIKEQWKNELHRYMAGILKNNDSPALLINSVDDHVHILLRLSKNYALAKVIEVLKKDSSSWLKTIDRSNHQFSWQIGYGAFSVSSSKMDVVKGYINNQEEHHRKVSYQEEVERFLQEYDVMDYQAEYYWR